MITIKKKHICIEIDGNDVQTLSDICEITRMYLRDNKDNKGFTAEFSEKYWDINSFITKIFDL